MMRSFHKGKHAVIAALAFVVAVSTSSVAQQSDFGHGLYLDPGSEDSLIQRLISNYPYQSVLTDTIKYIPIASAQDSIMTKLDRAIAAGDSSLAQFARNELAMMFTAMNDNLQALNWHDAAIDHYKLQRNMREEGLQRVFIADILLRSDEDERAIIEINNADNMIPVLSDDSVSQDREILINTSSAMVRNGLNLQAGLNDTLGMDITRTMNDPDYSGLAMLNCGTYYLAREHHHLAVFYLLNAADEEPRDGAILRDIYKNLAAALRGIEELDMAYSFLEAYSFVNDSLLNDRRQKILNRLLVQMRLYDKQAEIRDLEKDKYIEDIKGRAQNITTISLLIGSLIILFGTYIAIRNYQKRLSANQIIHKQNEEINTGRINELENNLKIKTMHSMILGQEAERERVARDLHDSLGGLLSTVKLHFDALQSQHDSVNDMSEYKKAYALLDEACKEVRSISNNMQPGALLKMGLVPAINDLVNRVQSDETPQIDFQHYGVNGQIKQTSLLNIYRIVQELLNNSIKHAGAEQILIQLVQKDNELIVMVEDDGSGYDPEIAKPGMGTENINSRVSFLKGELSIQSKPGDGTTTLVTIPLS